MVRWVGLEAEPRPVLLDPQRLVREDPGGRPRRPGVRLQVAARQEQVPPVRRLADGDPFGRLRDGTGRQVHHRDVGGAVGDLHPVEELHRLQVRDQRLAGPGFDVRPDRLPVVDQVERVLDVAVGGEYQRLGGLVRRQVADVLGEQQVQPGTAAPGRTR
ncbi:hypothetical protein GCM10023238_24440 [Streptomyces heliomycini]